MLGWDGAAMMPPGGAAARGDQMAVLAGLSHELLTAPDLADDLAAAHAPNDDWSPANLALMREAQIRATALPQDLVEAVSRTNSACETIWRTARPAADFAAVLPALTEVFNLTRQAAAILGEKLNLSPYDALMSGYQRGARAADATPIFARYETFLKTALPRGRGTPEARAGRNAAARPVPGGSAGTPVPAFVRSRRPRLPFRPARQIRPPLPVAAHPRTSASPPGMTRRIFARH